MKKYSSWGSLLLVGLLCLAVAWRGGCAGSPGQRAGAYLASAMDRYHATYDVYTDADAAGNHFAARSRICSQGGADAVPAMDEDCAESPHAGSTGIKCYFTSRGDNWGGWYFGQGILQGEMVAPAENTGDIPKAGVDLSGATQLTFWARGTAGGEQVEFFALGLGRDAQSGAAIELFPDSSPKAGTGYVTLSRQWKRYAIDLGGRNLDYVIGGFGWVASATRNKNRDIVFYLDDIQYDKGRLNEPRFLVSYEMVQSMSDFDRVMRNVGFTYDNALALLAFLSLGDLRRAGLIADALVYAMRHDRFYDDGRLRNGYQGGDLCLPAGWTPNGRAGTARMPGWYDEARRTWLEDRLQVSTHTGNVAWTMLALLAYHAKAGGAQYLAAAARMGEWVETNCRDARGAGGYTGGFEGWEPAPVKLGYKSTEHNLDLHAAFQRLYAATGDGCWRERAEHAKCFVLAMWDDAEGKFWTGTTDDGATINREVVPLDAQTWAVLALRDDLPKEKGIRAIAFAETHLRVGKGFDFNQDLDGVWYEGTAQMAVVYSWMGQAGKARDLVEFLRTAQDPRTGGLAAADRDELTTGFSLGTVLDEGGKGSGTESGSTAGIAWLYYERLHIGATAWLVLADKGVNPFWL